MFLQKPTTFLPVFGATMRGRQTFPTSMRTYLHTPHDILRHPLNYVKKMFICHLLIF